MKHIILLGILFLNFSCKGQHEIESKFTYENFNELILTYEPVKRTGVTDKDFKTGLFILNDTKSLVKGNASLLNSADFWNITVAFLRFKEPKTNIEITFKKAIENKNNSVCDYIERFGSYGLDSTIPELFNEFYKNCNSNNLSESSIDLKGYSIKKNLNYTLVSLINELNNNDQKYRKGKGKYFEYPVKLKNQRELDFKNQQIVDSLYIKYKSYIGKSLVGDEFSLVMWSIIQHSNLELMEKYLPVVNQAYQDGELLDVIQVKMLLDRVYGLKYGYQIFGTQSGFGFEFANEEIRNKIKSKYKIE